MTNDPSPRVRPLGPGDEPSVAPGSRRGIVLAVIAAAGVAAGFLIGAFASGGGITAPFDNDAPASAPDLAGPADTTTTTTTVPPTTTTVTTLPPTLADLVPSFNGTFAYAVAGTDAAVSIWPAAAPAPITRELPPGTVSVAWNADGSTAAAIAESAFGSSLFIDGGSGFRPLALEANAFRWHPTDPTQLAWTGRGPDDGQAVYVGRFTGAMPSLDAVVTGLDPTESPRVTAFGSWGFALYLGDPATQETELVTYDRDGERLAAKTYSIIAARDDGALVVTDDLTADPVPLYLTGYDLAARIPVAWNLSATTAAWSGNGTFLMGVAPGPAGSAVELFLPDRDLAVPLGGSAAVDTTVDAGTVTGRVVRYRIDTPGGRPLGWSSDDRFVLIYSETLQLDNSRGPGLLIVDIFDKSTHEFAVDGSLLAAQLLP